MSRVPHPTETQLTQNILEKTRSRLLDRKQELMSRFENGDAPRVATELDRVETALSWFDARLYGWCSVCGEPLSATQIEQDPADMVCPTCHDLHGAQTHDLTSLENDQETLDRSFLRARVINSADLQ